MSFDLVLESPCENWESILDEEEVFLSHCLAAARCYTQGTSLQHSSKVSVRCWEG